MEELIQKTFSDKKYFRILDDKIFVKSSSFTEKLEYSIKFEDLGFDIFRKEDKNKKIVFYFFLILDIMYIILLITGLIDGDSLNMIGFWIAALCFFLPLTVISFLNGNKSLVYLTGGTKVLEMMNNRPNESIVNDFIGQIHKRMRIYFKGKYGYIEPSLPKEYLRNQFKWLKEIEAISEGEYNELIKHLEIQSLL
ncbi:MAG: hypothetical protein U0X91_17925 [Spirosomataceae bacterium]